MTTLNVPTRYIQALVASYPIPLTQSELARRSHVTKSAISKTRSALLELCDLDTVARKKKLVLKPNFETFMVIFHVYFLQSKTEELFESTYAETVLDPTPIYSKLSRALREFSFARYFSKENVAWAIKLVLQNVMLFQIQKENISVIAAALSEKVKDENLSEIIPYFQLITRLSSSFEINIRDEVELEQTLMLRDKTYFFIRDNAARAISKLDVIKEIPNSDEKRTGLRFIAKIVETIGAKIGDEITENLEQQAEAKGISFPKECKKIGTLWTASAGR